MSLMIDEASLTSGCMIQCVSFSRFLELARQNIGKHDALLMDTASFLPSIQHPTFTVQSNVMKIVVRLKPRPQNDTLSK